MLLGNELIMFQEFFKTLETSDQVLSTEILVYHYKCPFPSHPLWKKGKTKKRHDVIKVFALESWAIHTEEEARQERESALMDKDAD